MPNISYAYFPTEIVFLFFFSLFYQTKMFNVNSSSVV